VAEHNSVSSGSIRDYIRLTYLIPEMLDFVRACCQVGKFLNLKLGLQKLQRGQPRPRFIILILLIEIIDR